MKKTILTIISMLICVMVNAQSTYDLNQPFGFATRTSRTDATAVYNITGGGGYIYNLVNGSVVDINGTAVASSKIKVLKATDIVDDNTIKNAIKSSSYSVIIFDGSAGDFIINQQIPLDNVTGKTLLGINNARLCTKFVVDSEIRTAIAASGAHSASTSGDGGTLTNGTVVKEKAEYLTRQAIIDKTGDSDENYRKSGIFKIPSTASNIIIRNIKFVGPGAIDAGAYDLITATGAKYVWVDHCEFTDGMDGNFDITNSADFFTVSWCIFSYTERSYMHQNTNLLGSSDDEPTGYLNTTYAYNIWGAGCKQRMPMARVAKVHMLNNYYNCAGSNLSLCINPRANSEFLVEGNYFASGITSSSKLLKVDGATACTIANNNVASASLPSSTGSTVTVPYSYTVNNASTMKNELEQYAGATLFISSEKNTNITATVDGTEASFSNDIYTYSFDAPDAKATYPVVLTLPTGATVSAITGATLVSGTTYNINAPAEGSTVSATFTITSADGTTNRIYTITLKSVSNVKYSDVKTSGSTTIYYWNSSTGSTTKSNFKVLTGNYKTFSSGSEVVYSGSTYKYGLKMESSTEAQLTITAKSNVIFVFDTASKRFYLNGTTCTTDANNVYSAELESGSYTITKQDSPNLVAVYVTPSGSTPTPTLYTVTYNANGHGTCSTANWTQTSEGQNTTLPSVTAASGYTFLGWTTSSSATSALYNAGANYTPTADVTLYAVYQQEQQGGSEGTVEYTKSSNGSTSNSANTGTSYTIPGTYVAGGGNGSYTIGQTSDNGVKLRTGKASFSNTSSSLDGKNKFEIDVNNGYTITAITFKAANNYGNTSTVSGIYVDGDYSNNLLASSVTLNSDKATAEGGISGFTAHEKIEFAVETTVVGSEAGTQINFFAAVTYKANTPTPVTYTVSYNLNGHGSAIADVTGVTALPETLPTPTASGYTFGGWYTDNGLTTPAVAGATISANTTLYAKWTSSSNLSSMTWAKVCDGSMDDSWYGTTEAQSVADIVLAVQKNNGGWMKNDQLHKLTSEEYNTLVSKKGEHSCFDNYATTQEMRFLLKVYKSTGEQKYLDAFKSALDLIITAGQGKKGGWGQYWPDPADQYSYQKYITFNDDLMTNVMKMLQNVYEAKGEYAGIVDDATKARCKTAWDAAIECVLNCQIDDNGTKAIWCAQHDPADFLPAEGRPHEMPSAGPYESSNLLSYLMTIKNPSEALKTSIRAAVAWMASHKSFENKTVEDYTNSSGVADRHIVDKQGSNLWGRFIQIGGASGTAIYNKLWNKLEARNTQRAHHTTGTKYYEYQLLDASYDASKAYQPIYAIYTNDYPELFYRHLYNYDDTPDATDKYGALVATSLKAANRRSYQYLGSWPDAIINTEYPAWEAGLTESDFGGTLTDEEISPATYSSSSGSTWNFSDGFVVTSSSGDYANGNNNTVKFASGRDYTITIPAGYTVKKVSFTGYDNYNSADSYISKLNGTSYSSTQYVFPKKDSNGNATYAAHRFDLSSSPVTGSLTFAIAGNQTCLRIHLYCTTGDDDNPAVSEEKTFTFVPNDGTTTKSGSTYTRTSVANPSFSLTSSSNISSDSRFKLNENSTYYLNVPSNATVAKVEFTNCSENYYNNPNSGDNNTTTFSVASEGATVVTKDKNGNVLQYLSTGQLITSTLANHVTGTPISFTASGGQQLAFGSIVVYYTLTDKGSVNLLSQTISNGASVNRNGSVTFVFDDDVSLVNNAKIKVNGNDVRTEVSGSSVTGYFWDLTYGSTGNTITLAANSVQDGFGNKYAEPVSITFNVNSKTPVTKKAFDYIVGRDGATVDAAVTAINGASGTDRYYVFIPDGEYEMAGNQSNKMTWITRANVSLIGQSQNGTILKNTPTSAGISTTSTIEFRGGSNNNYVQDLTLKNQLDYGASGSYGVGVAFYDRGQKNILKNVSLLSNQDTYTSAGSRGYFENCKIAGTVDFICGSGDYYFNGCNLIINDRTTTNVITAPSTLASERWGYVFESCTISAENDAAVTHQGGKYYLGRPWKDAPASTYLNTTFNLLPSNAGWTNMENGLAVRFHEYASKNSSGTALSLSSRSVSACNGATADNPVLTATQAAEYTIHNVIGGTDGFDPTEYTEQVAVANVHLSGSTLTWDNSDDALCWIVFKDGVYYANPITNSLALTEDGTYTVRAANAMGGLGEASVEVQYVDISAGGAALAFTASVQGGSNAAGSFVNQETHYYNNWGTSGWAAQAYIGFNVAVPEGKQVKSATLKFTSKCGGNYDNRSVDVYLLDKTSTAAFNTNNMSLSAANETKISTETDNRTESTKTITLGTKAIAVLNNVVNADATSPVIFQLGGAVAGATLYGYASSKAPTLNVEFEDIPTPVYTVTFNNDGSQYGEAQNIEDGQTVSTPTAPTKSGYTFKGWSLSNGGTTAETFPYTVTADVSFYAIWEQNQQGGDVMANVTFYPTDFSSKTGNATKGDVNLTLNLESNKDSQHNNNMKCKSTGNTLTFSSNCFITSIEIFCASDNFTKVDAASNVSTINKDSENYKYTWAGSNTDVVITFNKANGQESDQSVYVSSIVVIYKAPATVTTAVASTRKFGSFSSVYNVDFGEDENADVKAYTAVVSGTSVNLTRHTGVLPAGTGVVLYAPGSTKSQKFNVVNEATALTVGNDMIGVPVATNVDKDAGGPAYVVNSDAFRPLSQSGTIAAGKAYIRIPEAQQGRVFTMAFNDWTTGISDSVVEDNESSKMKIYNLQGIEVKTPVKGRIYIINNKKCLFK